MNMKAEKAEKAEKDLIKDKNLLIDFIKHNKRMPIPIIEESIRIYKDINNEHDKLTQGKELPFLSDYCDCSLDSIKNALSEIQEARNKYCVKEK